MPRFIDPTVPAGPYDGPKNPRPDQNCPSNQWSDIEIDGDWKDMTLTQSPLLDLPLLVHFEQNREEQQMLHVNKCGVAVSAT